MCLVFVGLFCVGCAWWVRFWLSVVCFGVLCFVSALVVIWFCRCGFVLFGLLCLWVLLLDLCFGYLVSGFAWFGYLVAFWV